MRILYIGGCTRSGSTLVDRMLGQLPGFVSTGEFGLITTHSITENRLCGCGRRFRDCGHWQAVGERAFGGWDSAPARELVRLHPQVTRQRHIPLLVTPSASPRFARKLRRYHELLAQLYAALSAVTGAEVIVDSTKAPAYALALRGMPGADVRILQLVRDSRGTAYSASKDQIMKDSVDRPVAKHRYAAPVITARWMTYHLIFDTMRVAGAPGMVLRYEDFVRAPKESLSQIAAFAGRPIGPSDLDFITPPTVRLREDHTAVGNDSRLDQGTITLREDDAWRTRLPESARRTVTAMSWPLLKRWRYV